MLREHPDQGISRGRRGHAPIPDYLCRADVLSVSYRLGFVIGFHGCASQGGAGKQAALCSRISKDIGVHVTSDYWPIRSWILSWAIADRLAAIHNRTSRRFFVTKVAFLIFFYRVAFTWLVRLLPVVLKCFPQLALLIPYLSSRFYLYQ